MRSCSTLSSLFCESTYECRGYVCLYKWMYASINGCRVYSFVKALTGAVVTEQIPIDTRERERDLSCLYKWMYASINGCRVTNTNKHQRERERFKHQLSSWQNITRKSRYTNIEEREREKVCVWERERQREKKRQRKWVNTKKPVYQRWNLTYSHSYFHSLFFLLFSSSLLCRSSGLAEFNIFLFFISYSLLLIIFILSSLQVLWARRKHKSK